MSKTKEYKETLKLNDNDDINKLNRFLDSKLPTSQGEGDYKSITNFITTIKNYKKISNNKEYKEVCDKFLVKELPLLKEELKLLNKEKQKQLRHNKKSKKKTKKIKDYFQQQKKEIIKDSIKKIKSPDILQKLRKKGVIVGEKKSLSKIEINQLWTYNDKLETITNGSEWTKDYLLPVLKSNKNDLIESVKEKLFKEMYEYDLKKGEKKSFDLKGDLLYLKPHLYKKGFEELTKLEKNIREMGVKSDIKQEIKDFVKSVKEEVKKLVKKEHIIIGLTEEVKELRKLKDTIKTTETPLKPLSNIQKLKEMKKQRLENEKIEKELEEKIENEKKEKLGKTLNKLNEIKTKRLEKERLESERLEKERLESERLEKDKQDKLKDKKDTTTQQKEEEEGYIGDDGFYHTRKKKKK